MKLKCQKKCKKLKVPILHSNVLVIIFRPGYVFLNDCLSTLSAIEWLGDRRSDGMKGYLSPCSGETRPLIFRCPVKGMEGILTNQLM
ncbi:hypothetical protein YC2023_114195 [Brassica napus]